MVLARPREGGDDKVMRSVVGRLPWETQWQQAWHIPKTASWFKAPQRLGAAPLVQRVAQGARPFGDVAGPTPDIGGGGSALVGRPWIWRTPPQTSPSVVSRAPDAGRRERGAFLALHLLALAERGTHAKVGAVLGPLGQAVAALVATVDPSPCPLANHGCFNEARWTQAAATGAALTWWVRQDLRRPVLAPCADGS